MARLLLVDDDARLRELYAFFLEQRGHRVRGCASYRDARGELAREEPELLLADLELGLESGREELPRLWSEGALPPTLVVSGYVDAELEALFARIPSIVGVLRKPFDFERLEMSLQAALREASRRAGDIAAARSSVRAGALPAESNAGRVSEPDEDGWVEILPPGASA